MTRKTIIFSLLVLIFLDESLYAATPLPTAQMPFSYPAVSSPITSNNPSLAKPVGLGSVAESGNTLSLQLSLTEFVEPVDIYFGFSLPADPDTIYILNQAGTTQTIATGLVPWKKGKSGPIDEKLFGDIPSSSLPLGSYKIYLLISPAGTLGNYYLWTTDFIVKAFSPSVDPGQLLTIKDDSIKEGSEVTVIFEGSGGYEVTSKTSLTENGSVKIAVPPFINMATAEFTSGDISVSIVGTTTKHHYHVNELPLIEDAFPGEITSLLLDSSIENYQSVVQKVEALSDLTGIDVTDMVLSINTKILVLQEMRKELDSQHLTVTVDTGSVVLNEDKLRLMDQLVVAQLAGLTREIAANQPIVAKIQMRRSDGRPIFTPEDVTQIIIDFKDTVVPSVQAAGGVLSLVVGIPATAVSSTAPLLVTAGVTLLATGLSVVLDVAVDAYEGNDIDVYNSSIKSANVVKDGLISFGLGTLGALKWAGATISGYLSISNDSVGVLVSLREAKCAGSGQLQKSVTLENNSTKSLQDFCLLTGGIFEGEWNSPVWGSMVLSQTGSQVHGTYAHDAGRIAGIVNANVLRGTWSESPSFSPPNDAGDFEFVLSDDGSAFSGKWRYGSSGSWIENWDSTRQ